MAIYTLQHRSLNKIHKTDFGMDGIKEKDLRIAIKEQIEIIAPDCLVIAEEFSQWEDSNHRIDLLAVDKKANLVVIEFKHTKTGVQMELQSLSYAAMVSTLTFKSAVETYQKYLGSNAMAEYNLLNFLGWERPQEDNFASDVRIILISEDFSTELTTSIKWLNKKDIDINCIRLTPYKHQEQVFIDVQQIIPLPETEKRQTRIKEQLKEQKSVRSGNDYTKYVFEGTIYNKKNLVLAVISKWFKDYSPENIQELQKIFPQNLLSKGLFAEEKKAKEIRNRTGHTRHFIINNQILKFPDGSKYAICDQWGGEEHKRFIIHAKSLGYVIEEARNTLKIYGGY